MADAKLTALTEDTAPTSDDFVYLVNDPGGTPASKKATLANVRKALVAGSDTEVQFNDAGSLGGDAGLTYNKTTNVLSVNGADNSLNLAGSSTGNPVTLMATGSNTNVGHSVVPKAEGWITVDTDIFGFDVEIRRAVDLVYNITTAYSGADDARSAALHVFSKINPSDDEAGSRVIAPVWSHSEVLAASTKNLDTVYGLSVGAVNRGSGLLANLTGLDLRVETDTAMTGGAAYGIYAPMTAYADVDGMTGFYVIPKTRNAAHVTNLYDFYADGAKLNTSVIDNSYAFYVSSAFSALGTNSYAFWKGAPDTNGNRHVWRLNAEGITALYNKDFGTLYTPGGMDYERIVTQWNTNVAEIGTEASGTGTLRALRLLGSGYKLSALTSNGFVKTSSGDGTLSVDTASYLTTAVTSAIGTTNQINVSGATGAVTFSTPQDIATGSTPQFARLGVGAAAHASFGLTTTAATVGFGINLTGNATTRRAYAFEGDGNTALLFRRYTDSFGVASSTIWKVNNSIATDTFVFTAGAVDIAASTPLTWNGDVGLSRNAAGVLAAINGTAGQWGALLTGVRDAGTTTVTNGLTIGHQSTGTPAAGLGSALLFNINSSTTADQNAAQISALWTDATHASRSADIVFKAVNNAGALAEVGRLTGLGVFNAIKYKVNGTAGANFGPGLPTSVTVVDGIITAIS